MALPAKKTQGGLSTSGSPDWIYFGPEMETALRRFRDKNLADPSSVDLRTVAWVVLALALTDTTLDEKWKREAEYARAEGFDTVGVHLQQKLKIQNS